MLKKLKYFFEIYRINLINIISLFFAVIAFVSLYFVIFVNASSNDECLWVDTKINKDSVIVVIDKVKIKGVAYQAGIRNGDILKSINGKNFPHAIGAQLILNEVHGGNFAEYKIQRGDSLFYTQVKIKKLINPNQLASSLMAIFFFLVGFLVLTAKPKGKIQQYFYLSGMLLVISQSFNLSLPNLIAKEIGYLQTLHMSLVFISVFFLPILLVLLFSNFPIPFKFASKKYFKTSLIISALILFILISIPELGNLFNRSRTFISVLFFMIGQSNILFMIAIVISIFLLIINYIRNKDKIERKPIFIILIFSFITIAAVLYVNFVAPVIGDIIFNTPEYYAPILLIVLLPISIGYSILKYQLMDVSIVIRNTIIYGAATISLAIIYLLTVYGIGQSVGAIFGADYQNIVSALVFILFALILQSTKDKFQTLLTKRFYPEEFAYQTLLVKLSKEVTSLTSFDLRRVIHSIESTFVEDLKIKKFGMLLRNKNDKLDLVSMKNIYFHQSEFDLGASLLNYFNEQTLTNKKLVIEQSDFSKVLPDIEEQLIENEIFSIVPLMVKQKLIGMFLLGLKHSGSVFSEKDLELLNAVAHQTAIAIENARLYEAESEKLIFEKELEVARKIQQNLLPNKLPQINGVDIYGRMIPAKQVGGDYFDVIKIDESKYFCVVGDVSGKGISASLYMTKLQTLLRMYVLTNQNPKEILSEINSKLFESMERHWFVTLSLCYFDFATGELHFCRAGHMPLIIVEDGASQKLKPAGIGLGLENKGLFRNVLEIKKIKLKSGQLIFLYSDGIVEEQNYKNDFYGDENLENILLANKEKSSEEIFSVLNEDLENFRKGSEQRDDITAVVIKIL